MKVIVASTNPVKVNATKLALKKVFPTTTFSYQNIRVSSGVSHQPMTDQETLTGAINRATNASKKNPQAHIWIGIEGGVGRIGDKVQSFAWVAVKSKKSLNYSRSATFSLPSNILKLLNQGLELGVVMDKIFHQKNTKQKQGAVGILSKGLITRTSLYQPAIILALSSMQLQ